MFSDSEYDDTIEPYGINTDIDTDIDTILINTARTQASCIPRECWNQISVDGVPSGDKSPLRIAPLLSKDVQMILSKV
jgi:hypothetical protein